MKTFKEAFGENAELYRTNNPNEMFAVRSQPWTSGAVAEDDGTGKSTFPMGNPPPAPWRFDQKTNTFTDPKDPNHKVSASEIGLGNHSGANVPLALTELAHKDGALKDPWAQYAIDHHPDWKTDQIVGALRNDTQAIIKQDAPSGLDKFMETAIPLVVMSAMTAGAVSGFGSALGAAEAGTATAGATGGGTAAGAAAGTTATTAATTAAATGGTAATGGAFVGSSGFIPGFGNAIIDGALNTAAKNFVTSMVTSGGNVETAFKSGIGGLVTGGVGASLSPATDITGKVVNAGISGAAGGATTAALSGGDVLKGALSGGAGSAAGSYASNTVGEMTDSKALSQGVGGAASALTTGLINGNLDPSKVLNATLSSGAGGLAQDYGASPDTAGYIATATGAALNQGNIIGTGVNPADNITRPGLINTPTATTRPVTTAPVTTPVATSTPVNIEGNQGFGLAVPIGYQVLNRRDMNWGHRTGE